MHEVQSDQSAWDPAPDTRALGAVDAPSTSAYAAEASASPSPVAAPPRPTPAASAPPAGEWPPPAPAPEAVAALAPPADSSWLPSEDDWAPGAPAWDAPAPWERDTAQHEPFASDVPMEANAIDTDSLDDDAFFASLREAVRDDAPLGPRDEEQALVLRRPSPSRTVGGSAAAADASALHPLQVAPTPARRRRRRASRRR